MTTMQLTVDHIADETPSIKRIRLIAADGGALPAFEAGAHVTVTVPAVGMRKYSLVATTTADMTVPRQYSLGIRLDAGGGGGSRFMCALKPGDRLEASGPSNNFPLRAAAEPVALVAGGIGVTPLLSMAATLAAAQRPFQFIYAARTAGELAFKTEIERLSTGALRIHTDDTAGGPVDLKAAFAGLPPSSRVYMCGPKPMLKAGMDAGRALGWPRDRIAFELFYSVATDAAATPPVAAPVAPAAPAPAPAALPDGSFEVVLKSNGKAYLVPPDKSIVEVLVAAGLDPINDCNRGECGVCQVGVLEGIPDHRDHILSNSEKASNKTMQICVSRSKSPRLVLDL